MKATSIISNYGDNQTSFVQTVIVTRVFILSHFAKSCLIQAYDDTFIVK